MSFTMDDVAQRAGVSKSTVSLALNGKAGVSRAIQDRVLRAANELGYRLPGARTFQRDFQNKTLTVVHCYFDRELEYAGPEPTGLYLQYLQGIQQFIREQEGINLNVIVGYREGDTSHLGFQLLEGDDYSSDGLILMGGGIRQNSRLIERIIERRIPAVALSRNWSHLPISTVSQDHYQQAQIALEHLLELGHKHIGFVARHSDQNYDWFAPRLKSYQDTLRRHNQPVNAHAIAIDVNAEQALQSLLSHCPQTTAIFAVHNRRAVEVLTNLCKLELRVPQDISLIGLDNSLAVPEGYPQLTNVTFPCFKVGYLAAELLLRQINQPDLYYSNVLVQSYLMAGETCDVPPAPKKIEDLTVPTLPDTAADTAA